MAAEMYHFNLQVDAVTMKKLKAHAKENDQSIGMSARQALRFFLGTEDPYGPPDQCLACEAKDALQIHPYNKDAKFGVWACNKCFSSGRYFNYKNPLVLMNLHQSPV